MWALSIHCVEFYCYRNIRGQVIVSFSHHTRNNIWSFAFARVCVRMCDCWFSWTGKLLCAKYETGWKSPGNIAIRNHSNANSQNFCFNYKSTILFMEYSLRILSRFRFIQFYTIAWRAALRALSVGWMVAWMADGSAVRLFTQTLAV